MSWLLLLPLRTRGRRTSGAVASAVASGTGWLGNIQGSLESVAHYSGRARSGDGQAGAGRDLVPSGSRGPQQNYRSMDAPRQSQDRQDRGGRRDYPSTMGARSNAPPPQQLDAASPEHNLALKNAPRQVFELIGDPRTGIADDVTHGTAGEVTVDMIWHQLSNEVYWYKYEYAGNVLTETQRDSRLSDYSKNLMYLLRAKDPNRWSIDALADKFHIRRQRVLTILAHKEMESHQMETGQLLRGPLSIYACPVDLNDIRLDPTSGEPIDHAAIPALLLPRSSPSDSPLSPTGSASLDPLAASSHPTSAGQQGTPFQADNSSHTQYSNSLFGVEAPHSGQASTVASAAVEDPCSLQVSLSRVAAMAEEMQQLLLQELSSHSYDPAVLRSTLLSQLADAQAYHSSNMSHTDFSAVPAVSSSAAAAADGSVGAPASVDFDALRLQLGSLLDSLDPLMSGSHLREETAALRIATRVDAALQALQSDQREAVDALPRHYGTLVSENVEGAADTSSVTVTSAGEGDADATIDASSASETAVGMERATAEPEVVLPAAVGRKAVKWTEVRGQQAEGTSNAALEDAEVRALKETLEKELVLLSDAELSRTYFSMPPATRGSITKLVPMVAARLNAQGVDLFRSAKDSSYRGPRNDELSFTSSTGMHSSGSVESEQLPVDLAGFEAAPDGAVASVLYAVDKATAMIRLLQPAWAAMGGTGEQVSRLSSGMEGVLCADDVRQLQQTLQLYTSAHAMVEHQQASASGRSSREDVSKDDKLRMLQILDAADPSLLDKLEAGNAVAALRAEQRFDEADALATATAAGDSSSSASTKMLKSTEFASDSGDVDSQLYQDVRGARGEGNEYKYAEGRKMDWDCLAAYLDTRVAGRVYHRGSGERQFVRLPTYPAFEGYSLEEFDQIAEGEVSQLNRVTAEKLDDEMYERFHDSLLFNLGVSGERLWDNSKPMPPTNLRSELDKPMVVYNIDADGATCFPPLFVAGPTGAQRPLDEQELVFQKRRRPKSRLPYHMSRIRNMVELE